MRHSLSQKHRASSTLHAPPVVVRSDRTTTGGASEVGRRRKPRVGPRPCSKTTPRRPSRVLLLQSTGAGEVTSPRLPRRSGLPNLAEAPPPGPGRSAAISALSRGRTPGRSVERWSVERFAWRGWRRHPLQAPILTVFTSPSYTHPHILTSPSSHPHIPILAPPGRAVPRLHLRAVAGSGGGGARGPGACHASTRLRTVLSWHSRR